MTLPNKDEHRDIAWIQWKFYGFFEGLLEMNAYPSTRIQIYGYSSVKIIANEDEQRDGAFIE